MARPQSLKEPVRVNYIIERRHDKALRELAHNTNRNLSELVRLAIDNFLEQDYDLLEKPVRGELADIIALIDFMRLEMRRNDKLNEWELKKSSLGMMFGSQWWKIKGVVEMTVAALVSKGVDALHEEIVLSVDVPGTNRTKQEKYGFRIVTPVPLSRMDLKRVRDAIEFDAKRYGRLKMDVPEDGDDEGDE